MTSRRLETCALLVAAALLLPCPAALADEDDTADRDAGTVAPVRRGIGDKFFIGVGLFNVNFDTTARKDSPEGIPNPDFDLEDILGLDDSQFEGRVNGYWRMKPKHRLTFGYMLLGRNSVVTILDEEFEWDDTTWPVGAEVASKFNTEVFELGYNYSFIRKPRQEWGVAVGLSTFKFDYALAGEGFIELPDGTQESGFFVEEGDFWAPVPSIGVHVGYSITPKWFLRANTTLFGYSADSWKARYIDARALFEYYPWKKVGFGAGFSLIEILYLEKGEGELRVDYGFDGWTWYVGIVF